MPRKPGLFDQVAADNERYTREALEEDLTTPEHLLHLPLLRIDAGEIGATVGKAAVAYVREPENLAGLSGALLLPVLVFRGKRVPFLPIFLVSLMGEQAGRMAWRSYKNLEVIAQAASGRVPDVSTVRDEYSRPDPG